MKFPEGKILIPGVIDTVTTFVEHPELVAERIVRCANRVGRENVIAVPDCGFGTFGGWEPRVHPEIMWAKFKAMGEGARLATAQLWSKARSALEPANLTLVYNVEDFSAPFSNKLLRYDTDLRPAPRRNIVRLKTLIAGAIAYSVLYGLARAFFSSSTAPKNSGDLLVAGSSDTTSIR